MRIFVEHEYRQNMKEWSKTLENKTILVAEDEEMNFLLIKEIFRKSRMTILRAETGIEAVRLVETHPEIELILMDIKMPGMNGYEATRTIKKTHKIPIIAQTAYAMSGEETECMAAGCDAYITKPLKIDTLMDLAHKFLNS